VMHSRTSYLAKALAFVLTLLAAAQPITARACWGDCEHHFTAPTDICCGEHHCHEHCEATTTACHGDGVNQPQADAQDVQSVVQTLWLSWLPCSCPPQCECQAGDASRNAIAHETAPRSRPDSQANAACLIASHFAAAPLLLHSPASASSNASECNPSRAQLCRFVI
ncbi:MAG TPA: hypothetical protein VL096_20570, partial [Pirellulaceae bacterium]|nr:hypothetical protein [Pirellulaceae bacterium]